METKEIGWLENGRVKRGKEKGTKKIMNERKKERGEGTEERKKVNARDKQE